MVFGGRQDKNPLLKYFTPEDFGLVGEGIELRAGKTLLRGDVYGEGNTTVVFLHGMGAGCAAYTTEIAKLVSFGWRVAAVDYRGCGKSEGKSTGGMYSGVECAVLTARYVKHRYGGKIVLAGHSWGAYSALCAARYVKVDGVAAISAPDTPARMLSAGVAAVTGGWAVVLTPLFAAINFVKFGAKGNLSAAKCIEKSRTPALLIHGAKDKVVPLKISAYAAAKRADAVKMLCENKAHNPYNTENAERLLAGLSEGLAGVRSMTEEERDAFFSSVDYRAACEEDESVMLAVKNFVDGLSV